MHKSTLIAFYGATAVAFTAFGTPAAAQLNCRTVEALGNGVLHDRIVSVLRDRVRNSGEIRISRGKKLQLEQLESLKFSGCRATTVVRVTLKRKIRRDARGTVQVAANVDANVNEICLNKPRVEDVRLSHTLRIGEAVYRFVANKMLPRPTCFQVPRKIRR